MANRHKKVNTRVIARAAGYSQSTVSKVLNNHPDVAEETRSAVLSAIAELNYQGNRRVQPVVSIILPGQGAQLQGYSGEMLSELNRALAAAGYRQEIVPEDNLALLNRRYVQGAVAIGWSRALNQIWGEQFSVPLIRLNVPSDHRNNCFSVLVDAERSLERLIGQLYTLGHRRIGFWFTSNRDHEVNNASRRLQGYLAALATRKLNYGERYCVFNALTLPLHDYRELLQRQLADGVSAVITADERGNIRLMQSLQELKVSIPRDLSVIGWELADGSEFFTPPWTSLRFDYRQAAEAAVHLLGQTLAGKMPPDVLIEYRTITRQSVGPAQTQS